MRSLLTKMLPKRWMTPTIPVPPMLCSLPRLMPVPPMP
jgi:hypothetical protein